MGWFTFTTPTTPETFVGGSGRPNRWRRSLSAGISLLKIGGIFHEFRWPNDAEIASATKVYRGGFENEITLWEADELTAAGYGAGIRYNAHGYGVGYYGYGGYGR